MEYFTFTVLLAVVFAGIVLFYYSPKRKEKVESPKHKMLDEDN